MPTIAVVTMVRNACSWLEQVLPVWTDFADGIIALDDNSDDQTYNLLIDHDAEVYPNPFDRPAWGQESGPRSYLFDLAHQSDYNYLFWLDADMVPGRDPRPLIQGGLPDTVAFRLFDLWSADTFREDGYWYGHTSPRPWLIRRPSKSFKPEWGDRGIHCGHFPSNLTMGRLIYAPEDYSLLHYAYSTAKLRAQKLEQYMTVVDQLSDHEIRHAESIGDETCLTRPLPFVPQWQLEF